MIWWLIGGIFIGAGLGIMIGGMLGRASMRDEIEDAWWRHRYGVEVLPRVHVRPEDAPPSGDLPMSEQRTKGLS